MTRVVRYNAEERGLNEVSNPSRRNPWTDSPGINVGLTTKCVATDSDIHVERRLNLLSEN